MSQIMELQQTNNCLLDERRLAPLFQNLSQTVDLKEILDLFETEIEHYRLLDGFVVSLQDEYRTFLINQKVRFTKEFEFLNQTYLGYRIPTDSEYLSARAYRASHRLLVNKNNAGDEERELLDKWKLTHMAALPIRAQAGERPLGIVLLLSRSGAFPPACIALAEALIEIFYQPLRNAHEHQRLQLAFDHARTVNTEHERFLEFIVTVNNLRSPFEIYELFKDKLFHQFRFDGVSFFMLDQGHLSGEYMAVAHPRFEAARDAWYEFARNTRFALDASEGGVPYTFVTDGNFLFRDVQEILSLPMSSKDVELLNILGKVRTLLMVPIRYQQQPIGVLSLYSLNEPIEVTDADIRLLTYLAAFLGTAITHSKQYALSQEQRREIERLNLILQGRVDELSQQVSVDRLTGLYNFRAFQAELNKRVGEFKRSADKLGLSLAIIDIDHFKRFNDTYGHAAGNEMLAATAEEIAKLTRKEDFAGRYGGEEFVVILPQCNEEGVALFAERVRTQVKARAVQTSSGSLTVTVSVGCATHIPDESEDQFFCRADAALYRAKKAGRDRIEAA